MLKLADSNIWLALTLSGHVFHRAARTWLEETRAEDGVVFCRSTQQSFLRLLTTAEVLAPYGNPPLSNAEAWQIYESWLADERISFVEEPRGLDAHWKNLAARDGAAPKLWMDAYLAAFATLGRYQMVTTDRGFKQFKALEVVVLSDERK